MFIILQTQTELAVAVASRNANVSIRNPNHTDQSKLHDANQLLSDWVRLIFYAKGIRRVQIRFPRQNILIECLEK